MDFALTDAVHRAIRNTPDRLATIFEGRRQTFAEFGDRIATIAGGLVAAGLRPGEIVPIIAMNSDDYLAYFYAVPWAGGVVCPLNYRWSVPELLYALRACEARILLVGRGFEEPALQLRQQHGFDHVLGLCDAGPGVRILAGHSPITDRRPSGDDLYGVFFTGGTTGTPKGVMLSHRNVWTAAAAVMAEGDIPAGTTYLRALPMFHLGDGAWSLATLLRSGTHVILERFDPEIWLDAVQQERVTSCGLVPTALQVICENERLPHHNLTSLTHILYGGSPFSEAGLRQARQALPQVAFSQGYGMTEYASLMAHLPPSAHINNSALLRSAGRANAFTELRIVDADGNDAPPGAAGEIQVRGPQIMLGYWRRPDLTATVIRDGWLCSGDIGRIDADGFLFVVDRLKDMIVTGGENVFSAEVENALATHPAVARVAVIGIPCHQWGECVHAVIVLQPGAHTTEAELRAHCAQSIARFKCPRSVEFCSELPLTSFGKVAKQNLRAPFWAAAGT